MPESFHIKPDAVGKTYKKLGIETGRNSKERGAKLTPEIIETLSRYFPVEKGVTGVIDVTGANKSSEFQGDNQVTSKVTPIFQVSSGVTTKNNHENKDLQQE